MATAGDDEWRNLLESSTNLNLSHTTSRINRSLKGIEKEAQRLSSKTSRHVPANQLKDFAAQAGVDIRNQSQYISAIDISASASSLHPKRRESESKLEPNKEIQRNIPLISGSIHPTNTMDITNFLKYHHEYVISSTIQECQLLSSRHFRKKYGESIQEEWNQTKGNILNYLGCDVTQQQPQHNTQLSLLNYSSITMPADPDHDDDDIKMNNNNTYTNNLQMQLQERLSKIVHDLSSYRNISSPLIDFDRNTNVQKSNIFAPISQIGIIHRQILEEYKLKLFNNKESEKNESVFLLELESLCDLWQCLSSIIFERGINEENECYLKENEYLAHYKDNNVGLQRFLAVGCRQYLEKMYFNFIEAEITKNKSFARRGGKPGKKYIICAFVRLKYQNGAVIPLSYKKVEINGEIFPLWPLIYYSYRIGDIDACIDFAKLDVSSQIIYDALCNLRDKRYKRRQFYHVNNYNLSKIIANDDNLACNLDEDIWKNQLDAFYKENIVKKSQDPFEITMYILIGKFFVSMSDDFSAAIGEVMNRQEDFLWFKLCTLYFKAREKPQWIDCCLNEDGIGNGIGDDDNSASVWIPCITLKQLQNEIEKDIGPNHFDNSILFVISLILSQQFEAALSYLAVDYPQQAIHIGICLRYYGLIDKNNEKLKHLVINYLHSSSEKAKGRESDIFHYLYIIDELHDGLVDFLCRPDKNLRQLVIGKINNESINIDAALLYKYCDIDTFISICKLSAKRAYEAGEIEHCIILYILCGDFNLSSQICIKLLSSHITDKAHNHSKQFIVNLAKHLFTSNKQISENQNFHSLSLINKSLIRGIDANNSINLVSCIHFAEFYDFFYKQQQQSDAYEEAIKIIKINGMIPINDENVISLNQQKLNINQIITPYKNKVLNLDNDLKKYIGEICVAVLQILFTLFQSAQNSKDIKDARHISTKCYIIYNFFNHLESQIKPIGAGDTAKQISNLYFQTRMD